MRIAFLVSLALMQVACTTAETAKWVGVGGSKADGAVVLGIDIPPKMGISETLITWDIKQANDEADRRCQNWGYARAEVFNDTLPVLKTCFPQGLSPCWSKSYRVHYQCIDAKKPS